ncbi:YqiA/YcfP family alpha/beta fold hydrolase [Azomonas macrocytogenes]|uniref:Esterase n=1 Tax=Azomonas macrocytogenes TaxID=69962 RepID=A0A839T272_AZOMA|nr:YqiA/YcfP family alpha/beta fold hydrolase [Azomonas macrocytogenes]MBB3102484.1 hypothetical protein [Azomonas macrocytogenes]
MSSAQPSILYIHGFNSSPHSLKARQLGAVLARLGLEEYWRAPALDNCPRQAIGQLQACIAELGQPLLVGSSLGGYYATWLAERHGLKALLINPAVNPHLHLFEGRLGPQTNYHTGERWVLTKAHVTALAALAIAPPRDSRRYQVWLQTGDQTLDYREALAFYQGCTLHIEQGGDHAFQGFAERLPLLLSFAGFAPSLWRAIDFSAL